MDNPNSSGGLQLILLAVTAIIAAFFIRTQYLALKAVRPENRSMPPGYVWLQLIPLFGLVWMFIVVLRIAGSFRKEVLSRADDSILGIPDGISLETLDKKPTAAIGIAYCILTSLGIILSGFILRGQAGGGLLTLSGLVCWIIYWVRVARFKKKLGRIAV